MFWFADMRAGLRARSLDVALVAIGLAITWTFPTLLRILAATKFQAVWPGRYPDRR